MQEDRLLKISEVVEIVKKTRAGIYQGMQRGDFPQSVKTGPRSVRWRWSDIQRYIKSLK